jgi:DNA-directed RNA polymerase subunit RPC12/RpoP
MMLAKDPEQRPSTNEMSETLTYIHSCFEEGRIEELTYIEKTNPTKHLSQDEEQKKTQDIARAAEKINGGKSKTLKSHPSLKKKKSTKFRKKKKAVFAGPVFDIFLKYTIPIAVSVILYFTAGFVYSMIEEKPPEFDFKGMKSSVECSSCGNLEIKNVIDITKCKCSKCGGQEWFAYTCNNCNKIFPWDEDKIAAEEEKLEKAGADDTEYDSLYVCPYCKSADIVPLPWEHLAHNQNSQQTSSKKD